MDEQFVKVTLIRKVDGCFDSTALHCLIDEPGKEENVRKVMHYFCSLGFGIEDALMKCRYAHGSQDLGCLENELLNCARRWRRVEDAPEGKSDPREEYGRSGISARMRSLIRALFNVGADLRVMKCQRPSSCSFILSSVSFLAKKM